ncbi:hypothetical protein KR093_006503 [Drosophila rubida]|uniref:Rhythmically expressed gene 2 protein n=1 Tax=Drosophila rubida TaxID=30044 RepID=A0AAD4KB41_9MUSC|nr:hypothetical protein KR093_006503 [Drosophila rubida]
MSLTAQFVRNLQPFRLVTFDVTDTLIKLNDPIGQYVKTAAACGVGALDKTKMAACFGQQFKWMSKTHPNFGRSSSNATMNWQNWWRQLVTQTFGCVDECIPPKKVAIIAEELLTVFRSSACWTPVEGAQQLVERMRLAGKCVGIISNFDPSVEQVLAAMGFGKQFDFILSSYEAGVMKPDPRIFQQAAKLANTPAQQALHIGNKYDMDYEGARCSGWSSLLVQSNTDAQPMTVAADHTFVSLAEMLHALETQEIRW